MKVTLHAFLTLDGVMQAPVSAEEDTSAAFEQCGWLLPYVDDGFAEIVAGWFARADAFLLGRTTYDLMRAYWPGVDDAIAERLNGLPKHVVSTTLQNPDWAGSTVLSGDIVDAVTRLKARPGGELQVHGSWMLAGTLHAARLIDEYRLLVFPVSVGRGKRLLFTDAPATKYRLVESRTTASGVVSSVLRPTRAREDGSGVVERHAPSGSRRLRPTGVEPC
jgi:dihydrofolate reductase